MKYIDGTEAQVGDLISWHVYDFDDNVTWEFFGIYKPNGTVVYMGGGADSGRAIGKVKNADEVILQSEGNDEYARGITKIGVAMDVVRLIGKFMEDKQLIEKGGDL
tara:strand:+ start:279 stop:596 length:318 start_codon:yes stop_codon:yes gene_type:complete